MNRTKYAMIRAGDVVIIALAVVLVVLLGLRVYTNSPPRTLRITDGQHEHRDYPVWQSRRISVQGPLGETIIEIDDGRARVLASPCTQKLCMRSGWLDAAGEATACVPNRVSVALLGDDPRYDAMNF